MPLVAWLAVLSAVLFAPAAGAAVNAGIFEELRAALEVVRAAVDHIFGAAAAQLQVPLDAICAALA